MAATWEIVIEEQPPCPANTSQGNASISLITNDDVNDARILFSVITISYIPFIIVGNVLILGSTYTFKKLRTAKNFILCSLAVSDLIMGFLTIPMFATAYFRPDIIRGRKYPCFLWMASIQLAGGCSLSSLLLITVDRYIAVFAPLKYDTIMSKRNAKMCISIVWLYNILLSALPALGYNNYDENEKDPTTRCNYYKAFPWPYILLASLFHISFNIGLSFILNVHVFLAIANRQDKVKKQGINVEYVGNTKTSSTPTTWPDDRVKQYNEKVKTVRLSFVLFSLYIIFWIPYLLLAPVGHFIGLNSTEIELFKVISQLFNFFNAVINAPIYAYMRVEYRIAYRQLLTTNPFKWYHLRKHTLTEIPGVDKIITGWSKAGVMIDVDHSLAWKIVNFVSRGNNQAGNTGNTAAATIGGTPTPDTKSVSKDTKGASTKTQRQQNTQLLTPRFSPSTKVM